MKKLLLMLLLGISTAHANTIYLDDGFIAQTDNSDKWGVHGSGNSFYSGLFAPGSGDGSYTNPVVTLSNSKGSFSFNSIDAYSFYPFDPVEIAIYSSSTLVEHFKIKLESCYWHGCGEGNLHQLYDFATNSWTTLDLDKLSSRFVFNKTYTNVSYITLVSDFSLGFTATLPTTVAAVPEPETYALLGCGLLLLGAIRRNRNGTLAA